MPCYIKIKRSFLQGLLWLYLYGFGFMALSLEPGFLDFDNLPDTNFSCVGKVIGGYYADLETNCQMFHVCTIGQLDEPMDIRFLCLNGTVFDQETRVCERIDEVDCTKSEQFYSLNLELYGHSQFSNLEENSETEQPLIIKSTLPTTTTTTSTPSPTRKTTHVPFYTSVTPPTITTLENRLSPSSNHNHQSSTSSHLSVNHHFPVISSSATDIRFNPEEINISLHPGAPPDIRTYYSDKNQLVATTHRSVYDKSPRDVADVGSSTQKNRYNSVKSSDNKFRFRNEDSGEYTEPPESFRIRTEYQGYTATLKNPQLYKSSTFRNDYTLSNLKVGGQKSSTTLRNYFVESLKPPTAGQQDHYATSNTEKNLLPPLPSLPTLTFSSPAPFSLQQRNEQKRYTKDHIPPPRIVISASASVSDASGKRLNYSLGTIGAAQLFKPPPRSYDEYKDEDVALDPFYLDVPKVTKSPRKKRETEKRNYDDEEILDLLKFLLDWYKNEKNKYTTPLDLEGIASINHELAPETDINTFYEKEDEKFNNRKKNNKYSTLESLINHEKYKIKKEEEDYVNDNYEPLTYINKKEEEKYKIPINDNIEHFSDDNIVIVTTEAYQRTKDDYFYQTIPTITENPFVTTENTINPTKTTTEKSRRRNKGRKYNDRKKTLHYNEEPFSEIVQSTTEVTKFVDNIVETTFLEPRTSFDDGNRKEQSYKKVEVTKSTTEVTKPLEDAVETSTASFLELGTSFDDGSSEGKSFRRKTSNDNERPLLDVTKSTTEITKPLEDVVETTTVSFFDSTTSFDDENSREKSIRRKTIEEKEKLFSKIVESITEVTKPVENIDVIVETTTASFFDPRTSFDDENSKENSFKKKITHEKEKLHSEVIESITEVTKPLEDVVETTTTSFLEHRTLLNDESTTEVTKPIKDVIETTTSSMDYKTNWSKDLKVMIRHIESDTNSVVASNLYKQGFTEIETTTIINVSEKTESLTPTTTEWDENTTTELIPTTTTRVFVIDDNFIPTTLEDSTYETTTEMITTLKPKRRGGRRKSGYGHRFSSDQFTRRSKTREPKVKENFVDALSREDVISSTENPTKRKDFLLTDYPLRKSVNPTQSERSIVTTPFSQRSPIFFNCFDKKVDKFYPDIRDCKLFHYCTQGYTKNQLLDLKFVCDFNTFFDDEKLICTKTKPKRCS